MAIRSRDKILESAREMIALKGYDGTSVHEICQNAGVSKGAFYHYFETKQTLFNTLVKEWLDALQAQVAGAISENGSVVKSMIAAARETGNAFAASPISLNILVEYWRLARQDNESWLKAVQPYSDFMQIFEKYLSLAQEQGDIDPGYNTSILAHLFVAIEMGYLMQASLDPKTRDWGKLNQLGVETVLKGLRSKK